MLRHVRNYKKILPVFLHDRPLLLAVISGCFLGGGLVHPWLWPLVIVGTALCFSVLTRTQSVTKKILLAWGIGCIKAFIVLIWFTATLPFDWLGDMSMWVQIMLLLLYWVPAALTLGSGLVLVAVIVPVLKKFPILSAVSVAGVVWLMAEMLGALIFSIYTLGPGSVVNSYFSFGYTGYAFSSHAIVMLVSSVGGVYILSILIGMCGFYIEHIFARVHNKRWWFVGLLLITSIIPISGGSASSIHSTVALVQSHFTLETPDKKMTTADRNRSIIEMVHAALATEADYVVLPEDARFTSRFSTPERALWYIRSVVQHDVIVVDTARLDVDGQTFLRAYIYDTAAKQVYSYDKAYLVPQGEYIPYVYQWLIGAIDSSGSMREAVGDITYQPGMVQSEIVVPGHIPAVLFCFESVSPVGVYHAKKGRDQVPFIAHVVSHSWFNREPEMLWHQLDAMLQIQSRFNGVPILQAANEASVKVYYPNGVHKELSPVVSGDSWSVALITL